MKRRSLFALIFTGLALIGFVGYETHLVRQQEGQLRTLRQRAAQLAGEPSALQRERDTLAHDLSEAERQLAALPPLRSAGLEIPPERRSEMKAWLARMKRLRQLFVDRPDQRIPEMQFLSEQDWLRVAKNLRFDSDEDSRRAFAAIRDAAAANFKPQLTSALRKFAQNPPNDTTTILALQPFSDPPIDSILLERYELSKTTESTPRWRVQTKAPLDADYDSRSYVDAYVDHRGYGGGSLGAPWAWIPDFEEHITRAYKAYAAANKGTSAPSLAEALPYFKPPLTPPLVEKLLKAEREQKR